MLILGIDPGIATLGYGVIEKDERGACRVIDYGVVKTPKEESLSTRLVLLEDGVNEILKKFHPDEIAMEELFFSKNITTGIAVAHARGVAMLACVKFCPYLYEYTPMQIKQALTGYGKAEKAQIQQVVTTMLRLESVPKPDDAADALAIALCHASVSRFGGLFKVGNTTRTKGHNTVTGSAFQQLMAESGKKQPRKKVAAGEGKPQAATKKPQVKRAQPKPVATGKQVGVPKKTVKPSGTAAEIARKLVSGMKEE